MKLAPIVVFTYNRPEHLTKTLKSLKKNELASKSNIYFFSDGAKNTDDKVEKKQIERVKKIIQNLKGFKKKKVFYHNKNIGLKKNIIFGISLILKKYKKIIVIEDDIQVGKNFLNYMNLALEKYKKTKKVWHISGWNYNLYNNKLKNNYDAFFIRNMNCWGWGTWENRWKKIIFNPSFFIKKIRKKDIFSFNLSNSLNNWSQIIRNKNNELNTWAIFWNATIFYHRGLCLNPNKSLTRNIGLDGSGTNCSQEKVKNFQISKVKKFNFPKIIEENTLIRNLIIENETHVNKKSFFSIFYKDK